STTLQSALQSASAGGVALQIVEQDDRHLLMRGSMDLPPLLPGMTVTGALATADGVWISGALGVPAVQTRSLVAYAPPSPFDWTGGFSCSTQEYRLVQVDARQSMTDPNGYPLHGRAVTASGPGFVKHAYAIGLVCEGPIGVAVAHSNLLPGSGPDCELLCF